jgi:hypothetical protein
MIDYLCDNISIPSLIFLNIQITSTGLIPEIGFIGCGRYSSEYDMYNKDKEKCVRLLMPDFLKKATILKDQCFYSNKTEFLITKIYI